MRVLQRQKKMGFEPSLSAAADGDGQELRKCIEGLDVDRDGLFNRHNPDPPVVVGQPKGIHGRFNRPIPADISGSMGEAALHKAASRGRYDMCAYILSAAEELGAQASCGGAKVLLRQRNQAGQTPLMMACLSGSLETVRLLIDAGSELEAKDDINGYTALHAAVRNGHVPVAQALLAAKADPNSTDNMGGTALHIAARYDVSEAVDILAGSGCSLDMQRFSDHFTALHLACKHNQKPDTVQALLAARADPGLTSRAGYPPAYLAISQVHTSHIETGRVPPHIHTDKCKCSHAAKPTHFGQHEKKNKLGILDTAKQIKTAHQICILVTAFSTLTD